MLRVANAPFYLELGEETESPLGCFMHFGLSLWPLASAPNPFSTKHSTGSPYLIISHSSSLHAGLVSWCTGCFSVGLCSLLLRLATMMSPAECTGSSATCPSLHRPPRNRWGLPMLATPESAVLQHHLVRRLGGAR